MQTALGLRRSRPASRAIVLTLGDCARAGPAADARVSPVMERIVRDVVLQYKLPDVRCRPGRDGVDFDETKPGVPLHDARLRPVRRLITPDGADPGVLSLQRPAEWHHFADVTAQVGIAVIERPAVLA